MNGPWLKQTGLMWLRATECENDFAERLVGGVAVPERARTLATQARLGYCWSRLAQLFPEWSEFRGAADKSFRLLQCSFIDAEDEFRVYDHSFYLLFLAWYFRVTDDPAAIRLLMSRHAAICLHFDNAGAGGFGPKPAGLRSHNPYMHLLEAMLTAFQVTQDEFWLREARRIRNLFTERLFDRGKGVVYEFLHSDWSVAAGGRVEIGHQMEWSTLLLEMSGTGGPEDQSLAALSSAPYEFAVKHGFEGGLAIDATDSDGTPLDRRKLLWPQTEAARHFSVRARVLRDEAAAARAAEMWKLIRARFIREDGWSWYNGLTAEGVPVEEPVVARLLYHVVTAAAEE